MSTPRQRYRQSLKGRATAAARWQEYYPVYRERALARARMKKYGITAEQFEALKVAQGGRCAVCQEIFPETPQVDHCHKSGKIRGLLCGPCNKALGLLRDDPLRTEAATAYLKKHR